MHELGIVFHVIDLVEELGQENSLSSVTKVTLRLGEVTGVLPDYLFDCWNWAVKRTELMHDAELNVIPIEAVTICNDCGKTYSTFEYAKICPHCQSENTELLRGLEMELESIEGY